ncbi:MAG: hypothetical protein DDT33_01031 [Firmicutes bacterium]|nr:hypothetical protein [Bacillota bacterium]
MNKHVVNFSGLENFEPLPAGVYPITVVDYEENEGPAGIYFALTLEVTEGPYANRKLWTNLSLSPKAAWKLQEALIAFGHSAKELEGEFEFDPDAYLGTDCSAIVGQDKYEGRIKNVVEGLLPLTSAPKVKSGTSATKTRRPPKIR